MTVDVAIIGGGAAGLATAIHAARLNPALRIVVLDGAARLGAKILVSGGGRCNVTNARVSAADFWGGSRNTIRRVLAAQPVPETVAWFAAMGVRLHEEAHGKLFPDTNYARTVLDALLRAAADAGVPVRAGHRVLGVAREGEGFTLVLRRAVGQPPPAGAVASVDQRASAIGHSSAGELSPADAATLLQPLPEKREGGDAAAVAEVVGAAGASRDSVDPYVTIAARRIVLATGGRSLPRSGSDGAGYEFARALGHRLVPTTPALAPLVLAGEFHKPLAGVSHEVELTITAPGGAADTGGAGAAGQEGGAGARRSGQRPTRLRGALLWTHFGISGPAVLDASRHWLRARLDGRATASAADAPRLVASFLPGQTFESAERALLALAEYQPRTHLHNALAVWLPARVAEAVAAHLELPAGPLAHLPREDRRRLLHALLAWELPVQDCRGWNYAEATAGGVALDEIDPATMASRICPGLYLVGEVLDVDGRIGGFNFQWAWASAAAAARGLASG